MSGVPGAETNPTPGVETAAPSAPPESVGGMGPGAPPGSLWSAHLSSMPGSYLAGIGSPVNFGFTGFGLLAGAMEGKPPAQNVKENAFGFFAGPAIMTV